jgi:ribosomal protein S27AE
MENPKCPNCGAVHDGAKVIQMIKDQQPMVATYAKVQTSFACARCGTPIGVMWTNSDEK